MRTVDAAGLQIGDGHPPRVMGVVNVSAESPYDPSVFADAGEAAAYVDRELIDEGADVVDVGLESANRRYEVLSAEEELDRLSIALDAKDATAGDAVWSIETRYHEVAEAALAAGFEMVNDVCGFADPEMPAVCADYDVAVVKMASPPDLERPGAVEEGPWAAVGTDLRDADDRERTHVDDLYDALAQNGFTEKTILDPAFGRWSDAQTLADDRETFARLREFRGYGRPLLVSINRKNFLKEIVGRETDEALAASLAATSMAVERGADVVRTHDVAATRDAALVGDAFTRPRVRGGATGVTELDVTTDAEFARHRRRVQETSGGRTTAEEGESVVPRVFELDLSPSAADYLARRAVLEAVRVYRGEGVLVVGTTAEIRSLRAAVREGPGEVSRALDSVCQGLESV